MATSLPRGTSGWRGPISGCAASACCNKPAPIGLRQMLAVQTTRTVTGAGIGLALVIGTIANPLGFLPLAFRPKLDQTLAFRVTVVSSFAITTVGFVGLAIWVVAVR